MIDDDDGDDDDDDDDDDGDSEGYGVVKFWTFCISKERSMLIPQRIDVFYYLLTDRPHTRQQGRYRGHEHVGGEAQGM